MCHRGRGQAGGNKPAEIFCYEYHAHYAGVKRKACGGKPAVGFSCGREKLWKYCGRPMRKLPCGEFCRPPFRKKASDVHLEPCREFVLVRFRIDGTLTERYRLPPDMAAGLSVRAKVLGGMDVGKTAFPRTEVFRKSGKGKIRISVFP